MKQDNTRIKERPPGSRRSFRSLRAAKRRQQAWRRLMACIFFIPAFFSLLTFYISIKERDFQAALIFAGSICVFSFCGLLLWQGKGNLSKTLKNYLKSRKKDGL